MNEHVDFERLVAGHIADEGVTPLSDTFYDELLTRAGGSGQRPEWLAFIREAPMRTNNHLAVGSPTMRVAAILVATLLLALALAAAGAGAKQLLAADGTIVVAQDGSGDYTTIGDAVEAADDGDTIMVRPGTYVEAVLLDKDVVIEGDGSREDIVLVVPEEGPTAATGIIETFASVEDPYALLVTDSHGTIAGLTFTGPTTAVHVRGGSPTLEQLHFDHAGLEGPAPTNSSLLLTAGTRAIVRDNLFEGGGHVRVFDRSEPVIEGNRIVDGPELAGNFGDGAIVRGNTLARAQENAIAITNPTAALFEGNTFEDAGATAFAFRNPDEADGYAPVIRGNSITGSAYGVESSPGVTATIAENRFTDISSAAIVVASDVAIADNDIRGSRIGIDVSTGAPSITGNTVSGGQVGVGLTAWSTPEFSGNTVCGNETNVRMLGDAEIPNRADNEICDDGVAE